MPQSKKTVHEGGRSSSPAQVLDALLPDEAAAVLERLLRAHPKFRAEAEAIAKSLLADISFEQIALEVQDALTGIDSDHVYGRAGRHEWGHVEPGEAACELLEEAIKPFLNDMQRHVHFGMEGHALKIVQGILLGLYRIRGETGNAALEEATDFPDEMASLAWEEWTKRKSRGRPVGEGEHGLTQEWVEGFVPEWKWLLPKTGRRPRPSEEVTGKATRKKQ